jgi:hypothetical protein
VFGTVGATQEVSGRSLSWVTTFGYAGLLSGPAVIGLVAGATSLGVALLLPAVLALFITAAGPIAIRMTKPARPD